MFRTQMSKTRIPKTKHLKKHLVTSRYSVKRLAGRRFCGATLLWVGCSWIRDGVRLTRPSAARLSKATSLRPGAAFHVVHKNPSPLQLYLTHNFLPPTTFTLEQTSFLPFSRWRPSLPRIRLGLVFASACLLINPSLTLRSKSTSCMMAISIRINQAPDSLVNS
jgi:hypothetical protein